MANHRSAPGVNTRSPFLNNRSRRNGDDDCLASFGATLSGSIIPVSPAIIPSKGPALSLLTLPFVPSDGQWAILFDKRQASHRLSANSICSARSGRLPCSRSRQYLCLTCAASRTLRTCQTMHRRHRHSLIRIPLSTCTSTPPRRFRQFPPYMHALFQESTWMCTRYSSQIEWHSSPDTKSTMSGRGINSGIFDDRERNVSY